MTKPPASTPHSDLDGVDQDRRRTPEAAIDSGTDAGDLADAKKDSKARPAYRRDGGDTAG